MENECIDWEVLRFFEFVKEIGIENLFFHLKHFSTGCMISFDENHFCIK